MNPRNTILKKRMKTVMYEREEKGMTHAMTLAISERLDRRLLGITIRVREGVLIEVEKVVFS